MIAVMAKEWRRLLRHPGTPWALFAYLVVPLLVVGASLAAWAGGQSIPPSFIPLLGGHILNQISAWQILLIALAAPVVAAPLIAGEVEDGTLQPLLAAGPPLLALVTAKLGAAVSFLLVVILAGLPLFALPVLVGGVTWPLIGRAILLEVTTALMMTAIGLLLSAVGRRSGAVALAAIALGAMLTLGGGLVFSGPGPANAYTPDPVFMGRTMADLMNQPGSPFTQQIPGWLYANPLVGLNAAINQRPGQGLFGLPGANLAPVWGGYRLWQVQAAGAAVLALLAIPLAAGALWMRIRWPFNLIGRPFPRQEAMSGD